MLHQTCHVHEAAKKGKIENEKKGPRKIISTEEEILSFIFNDIFVSGVKYRTVRSGGKILSAFYYIPSSSEFFSFPSGSDENKKTLKRKKKFLNRK